MALGDVVADIQSIAAGAALDINPGVNQEWCINNIYFQDAVQVEAYDGVNSVAIALPVGPGFLGNLNFRAVGNADRIRVINQAATAKLIGYSGVQTK
jgi:hypothetical protein